MGRSYLKYSNAPMNRVSTSAQKKSAPGIRTLIIMTAVIALMFAVRLVYNPNTDGAQAAAVIGAAAESEAGNGLAEDTAVKTKAGTTEARGLNAQMGTAQASHGQAAASPPVVQADAGNEAVSVRPEVLAFAEVSSPFAVRDDPFGSGEEEFHCGIDLCGGSGVLAYADGVVEEVKEGESYGNYLILRHSDSMRTLYAHCSEILVSDGQSVAAGQQIAVTGSTGRATGVHLHFEVILDGERVDPAPYLGY